VKQFQVRSPRPVEAGCKVRNVQKLKVPLLGDLGGRCKGFRGQIQGIQGAKKGMKNNYLTETFS